MLEQVALPVALVLDERERPVVVPVAEVDGVLVERAGGRPLDVTRLIALLED